MNRKILFLVIVLIIITACGRPLRGKLTPTNPSLGNSVTAKTGTFDGNITSSGVTRHYLLHVPASYQQSNAVPLILNFHGYGSNSQEEENLSGTSATADGEGFIVVYPDGLDKRWNAGPGAEGKADQQFVR